MSNSSSGGGMGCLGVTQIVFIILKVTELIDWSWWLVMIPSFIALGLIALIVFIAVIATAFGR